MKKTIGIIGANGFVGSNIYNYLLSKSYNVISITSENMGGLKHIKYDVLINAGGNSKKYLAETEPEKDFQKNVVDTLYYIVNYNFKKYIHISSIDVENPVTKYGIHKKIAESLIKMYLFDEKYAIIRCSSILGKDMKKGVVYDILNNKPLRVSKQSRLQFYSMTSLNEVIYGIIKENKYNEFSCYGVGNVSVKELGEILKKKLTFNNGVEFQNYNFQSDGITTSKKFVENFIKEYNNERME